MVFNNQPQGVDRIESAANITLQVSKGAKQARTATEGGPDGAGTGDVDAATQEVPISRLDTTKEIQISEVRESSLKATGYSITAISYSGTMMFRGSTLTRIFDEGEGGINALVYDENGVPVPVSITITHDLNGEAETYQTVLVTSESYQVRTEEVTETAFDWVAMDRTTDQPDN
ncbi:tail tube [Haloarcula virus HCTV-15]|uniref:Tail tube n=1 Tax=Halorubrum sodomense tailed virus 2 TaxID=1262527 RepID=L7TJZ2_9CAUD|nr:tail tube protein [Halorubrum sodomense tailed virus 2]AGC34290.1 tail tube [Halorubrum sodomense tailed virus 2]UBF22278.1 tail tube [Halorubrum virus HRTV-11]UBF22388.1 tail tube [Haloarcula virus HCTV-6]UBF22495.1 tail tube [Haloarcula virus HCTV-15]